MSNTKNKSNCWRTVTRNGTTYLKSPDGTKYDGTPAEIRAARLYPWRRRNLAQSFRLNRLLFRNGVYTREELAAANAERRREAIRSNDFDHAPNKYATISENLRVDIEAAARATGMTADEYERRAIADAVERTRLSCGGELPYTRHELEAVA